MIGVVTITCARCWHRLDVPEVAGTVVCACGQEYHVYTEGDGREGYVTPSCLCGKDLADFVRWETATGHPYDEVARCPVCGQGWACRQEREPLHPRDRWYFSIKPIDRAGLA